MFCNQSIASNAFNSTESPSRRSRLAGRLVWGGAALGLVAGTILQVHGHGGGWLALGFALMPDLGLLAGAAKGLETGQMAPRAVPLYNAMHRFAGPAMLAALALSGILPQIWLSAALGWALHIAIDRTAGYGLRGADGFKRS